MKEDLLAIVSSLRASLEDAAARGVWGEDPEVPLPALVGRPPPDPARAAPPTPSAPAGWSELARTSREERPPPEVGLQRVRDELGDCRRCALAKGRQNLVFGVGDPAARLVVIGEAPGFHEDQQGEPFVGAAGQMLDRMLQNVLGLGRSQVYILNVVKCRPPNNRNPLPEEVDACRPALLGQLDAIRPALLLVLGSVAYRAVFSSEGGITRNRGRWHTFGGVPAMPTFHPAYLLRTPEDKKVVFEDLKLLKARYDELLAG